MPQQALLDLADALGSAPRIEPVEARYLGDYATTADEGVAVGLVRPRSTREVATLLAECYRRQIPVVPQGGRTGLTGGATPTAGAIIMSLERLNTIGQVDRSASTITVGAGALLQAVQEAAAASGMLFPLDIGARGSCTIGGNIATNAGGTHVLRYGMMRNLVLGLEAVLADGTVIDVMDSFIKNNAGYDLKHVFIGSEGTLGVITRAVLRLYPAPTDTRTALCAIDSFDNGLALLARARDCLGENLSCFEAMWPSFYGSATAGLSALPLPVGHELYVLIETGGMDPEHDGTRFSDFLERAIADGYIADAVIAQSERQRADLWAIRDAPGDANGDFWSTVGFDVALPIPSIGRFVIACEQALRERWPTVRCYFFGHVADSNIHINVAVEDVAEQPKQAIEEVVYGCVGTYAGSISAEHGIGTLKRPYLHHARTDAAITLMRDMKSALDPLNILNPGKVIPIADGQEKGRS